MCIISKNQSRVAFTFLLVIPKNKTLVLLIALLLLPFVKICASVFTESFGFYFAIIFSFLQMETEFQ